MKIKRSLVFFIVLWLLVFTYLLIMNSGFFPLYIRYDLEDEQVFISKLWPASNYKVENKKIIAKDSIYLDVNPNVNFEKMRLHLSGVCLDECEMQLIIKENFESGAVVIKAMNFNEWIDVDLSGVSKEFLIAFDFKGSGSYEISDLFLELNQAKWLNSF